MIKHNGTAIDITARLVDSQRLFDNPDLNDLGTGLASADFLPHQFNYLGWRMMAPFKAGWRPGAQSAVIGF